MVRPIEFRDIPRSLDDDEFPFLMSYGADIRPSLETFGAEYRRANDKFTVEFDGNEEMRLRAIGWDVPGKFVVVACAGPILFDWWPLLQASPPAPERPVLSAAAKGRPILMTRDTIAIPVTVFTLPDPAVVIAAHATESGLTAENIQYCTLTALAVIKTALIALSEHATLVNRVPEVDLEQNGIHLPLAAMIEVAGELASGIGWERQHY